MFLNIEGQTINLDNVEVARLGMDVCICELSNGSRINMRIGKQELIEKAGAKLFVAGDRGLFLDHITHASTSETMAFVYFSSGRRETIRGSENVANFIAVTSDHLLGEAEKASGEIEARPAYEDIPVITTEVSEQEDLILVETTAPKRRRK
jgi:hypothetical protein